MTWPSTMTADPERPLGSGEWPVTVTARLTFVPGGAGRFLEALEGLLVDTRKAAGLRHVRVLADAGCLLVIEDWDSVQAYEIYTEWRARTGFMEGLRPLLAEAPVVEIWRPATA